MTAWVVPTARATSWLPLAAVAGLLVMSSVVAALAERWPPEMLGMAAGAVAAATVAGLRDPAAELMAALPTSPTTRLVRRLGLLLPAATAGWLAYLAPGRTSVPDLGWPVAPLLALLAVGIAVAELATGPEALLLGVAVPLAWAAAARVGAEAGGGLSDVLLVWQHHPWIVICVAVAALTWGEDPMTDTTAVSRPRVDAARPPTGELARVEAGRMLRHPAPWLGLLLSAGWLSSVADQDWASAHYQGVVSAVTPLLLGISMATVTCFGRERTALADDAPLPAARRATARLLAGLPLVGVVAAVVAGGATWMRVGGGLRLGDEPGLTRTAQYTLPELLQPVVLAAFAIALGAALVHLLRSQLAAHVLLFVYWFLVGGTSWLFQDRALMWLTPVQTQPVLVDVGPADADPSTFPSDWLLSAPGEYQDFWGRLVVSPELAAWHDLYVVALTVVLVAVAVPGRRRRPVLVAGALLAAGAVVMQAVVAP